LTANLTFATELVAFPLLSLVILILVACCRYVGDLALFLRRKSYLHSKAE